MDDVEIRRKAVVGANAVINNWLWPVKKGIYHHPYPSGYCGSVA